jgi:hypothetical protein
MGGLGEAAIWLCGGDRDMDCLLNRSLRWERQAQVLAQVMARAQVQAPIQTRPQPRLQTWPQPRLQTYAQARVQMVLILV